MSRSRSLPVIMPVVSGQQWSCHSCGKCCRELVVHLFEEDRARIERQGWEAVLGAEPYVRIGRGYVLSKKPDGACVFLTQNNRCMIHENWGEAAKPLACRLYPFSVRSVRGGWQASVRFDCPSVAGSLGRPLSEHRTWLREVAAELAHGGIRRNDVAVLPGGLQAASKESEMVLSRYACWIGDRDRPLLERLIGAARVTAILRKSTFARVRGPRLAELLDLLFADLPRESAKRPASPVDRQRGMMRQLAFAHAEHVTIAEHRAGLAARLGRRWHQLRAARAFFKGQGLMPRLPGIDGEVTFDAIASVGPPPDHADEIEELIQRYLAARLAGRTVFGEGYYGWPIFSGLTALWLSVAAAGFLARVVAAANGRAALSLGDVAQAIGLVDRGATRLPALGTTAERARAAYLSEHDGVARLLDEYTPVGSR